MAVPLAEKSVPQPVNTAALVQSAGGVGGHATIGHGVDTTSGGHSAPPYSGYVVIDFVHTELCATPHEASHACISVHSTDSTHSIRGGGGAGGGGGGGSASHEGPAHSRNSTKSHGAGHAAPVPAGCDIMVFSYTAVPVPSHGALHGLRSSNSVTLQSIGVSQMSLEQTATVIEKGGFNIVGNIVTCVLSL